MTLEQTIFLGCGDGESVSANLPRTCCSRCGTTAARLLTIDRDRGRQVKTIVIINSGNARCPNRVRCTRRRPGGGGRLSSPRLVCNIISCYYYYYRRCNIRRAQLGRALYPPSPPLRYRRRDAPLLRDRFPPADTSVPGTLDDC